MSERDDGDSHKQSKSTDDGVSLLKKWFHQHDDNDHDDDDADDGSIVRLDRILVLDGGVSTHLESLMQQKPSSPPPPPPPPPTQEEGQEEEESRQRQQRQFRYRELWSSSLLLEGKDSGGEDIILQGHLDWLRAGCQVLSTVTYQLHYHSATWPKDVVVVGDGDDDTKLTPEIMTNLFHRGFTLAQQAVQQHQQQQQHQQVACFVVASLGCFGAALANGAEYTGDYGGDDENTNNNLEAVLIDFYRRKLVVVNHHQPRVDAVALETIPSIVECRALRDLFLQQQRQMKKNEHDDEDDECFDGGVVVGAWISLACRNDTQLNDGTPLIEALQVLLEIPSDRLIAIGLNCCHGQHVFSLVDILTKALYDELQQEQQHSTNNNMPPPPPPRRGMVVYPNSGEAWDATTCAWMAGTGYTKPMIMAEHLFSIVQQVDMTWTSLIRRGGGNLTSTMTMTAPPPPRLLMGGCCRTTPATLQALSQRIQQYLHPQTKNTQTNKQTTNTVT